MFNFATTTTPNINDQEKDPTIAYFVMAILGLASCAVIAYTCPRRIVYRAIAENQGNLMRAELLETTESERTLEK